MTKTHQTMLSLTYLSLWVLALGVLTSTSLLALVHIFLIAPCLYFLVKSQDKKMTPSMWALLAMIGVMILSVVLNLDVAERAFRNGSKIKYFIFGLLSVFAYREFFQRPSFDWFVKMKWPFRFLLIATTVGTISGLIGLWTGYNPLRFAPACSDYRACGLFSMLMTYAYGLSMLLAALVAFWVHGREKLYQWVPAKWFGAFMLINLVGLYFTYTRGAWLGLLLALPFIFFKKHTLNSSIALVSLVAVIVLSYLYLPLAQDIQNRGYSDTQRIAYWQTAIKAFEERPLLGYGYRNFEPNVVDIKKRHGIDWEELPGHAHNNFFEHLGSTGGLGALAFVVFCLLWLWEMFRRKDLMGEIGFVFVVSFLISGMFQYTFGDSANVFMIMGMYALSQVGKGVEAR